MKSVKTGLMSGLSAWLGFNGIGFAGSKQPWNSFVKDMAINTLANTFLPSLNLPGTTFFNVGISPMVGMGEHGLTFGLNASLFLNFGDNWRTSISFGATNRYMGWNATMSYNDWGVGYGCTNYNSYTTSNGNIIGAQNVGTITALLENVSIRLSNDCLGDRQDRWRSNAVEISIKNFVIGTSITTNNGKEESISKNGCEDRARYTYDGNSKIIDFIASEHKGERYQGIWKEGKAYSAPFWIGFKRGNQVYRYGYSHPQVQDKTQNLIHRTLAPTPLFKNYNSFNYGAFIYSGANSPYSLW